MPTHGNKDSCVRPERSPGGPSTLWLLCFAGRHLKITVCYSELFLSSCGGGGGCVFRPFLFVDTLCVVALLFLLLLSK